MDKYELGELSKTFGRHAEESKKSGEERVKSFKVQFPGSALPEHMMDDFCLPLALKSLVDEVMVIKRWLRSSASDSEPAG